MGYKFQFVTLAGFHALNLGMFRTGPRLRARRHDRLREVAGAGVRGLREQGYSAIRHQRFVGTGYFDEVQQVISGGLGSTAALAGSTESEQFTGPMANGGLHAGVPG